jgi:DNA invertase Pin-like site-specific DNA recombinase
VAGSRWGWRSTGAEPAGHVRLGYARASTARQSLDSQLDSLAEAGVTRIFSEKIFASELRASGVRVTPVVHEHNWLGRGIKLATLAEDVRARDVGLEFLTGELKGSHDPSGVVFTVLAALSGMEREYIRDRTLEGHESARKRGKTIGDAGVTDDSMPSMALHLRDQEMSLRDIAARLVITTGAKKGQLRHGQGWSLRRPRRRRPARSHRSPSTPGR